MVKVQEKVEIVASYLDSSKMTTLGIDSIATPFVYGMKLVSV